MWLPRYGGTPSHSFQGRFLQIPMGGIGPVRLLLPVAKYP